MSNLAYLQDRSVIKIAGVDAKQFLQGLVSNDINLASSEALQYSFLLSPQGRYYTDIFLFKEGDSFLLDICNTRFDEILARLKVCKLRSKVTFENTNYYPHLAKDEGFDDPRDARLGKRVYLTEKHLHDELVQQYHLTRIGFFIPDGTMDFIYDRTLILNYHADKFNGVSFTKGCFTGQEVTARMHYRDAISRGIFKIEFPTKPGFGSEIVHDGKKLGIVLGELENIGLALLNKEGAEGVTTAMSNGIELRIIANA